MIDNPIDWLNTDGIDIDCCSQVTVSDCIIRTGDDAITLRASGTRLIDHPELCEDVTITNCVLESSVAAFRIGVGSGTIRNIVISGIVIRYAGAGFLIQSCYGNAERGATICNISIRDIRGRGIGFPLHLVAGKHTGSAEIRDLRFSEYHAECCGSVAIEGNEKLRPDGIYLEDCSFTIVRRDRPCKPEKFPRVFWQLRRAGAISLRNCSVVWRSPEADWKQCCDVDDVMVMTVKDCSFPEPKSSQEE